MEFWGHPGTSLAGTGRGNYITATTKHSTFPQKKPDLTDSKTMNVSLRTLDGYRFNRIDILSLLSVNSPGLSIDSVRFAGPLLKLLSFL